MGRIPLGSPQVTHFTPDFVRAGSARVRSEHRRRSALALRVALSGMSRKQAARVIARDPTTVSRLTSGTHDTPLSRARDVLRKISRRASVAPIIADLLADTWSSALTTDELRALRIAAHQREQQYGAKVGAWRLSDMAGLASDNDEIDEAILAQSGALIELLALRNEERARKASPF